MARRNSKVGLGDIAAMRVRRKAPNPPRTLPPADLTGDRVFAPTGPLRQRLPVRGGAPVGNPNRVDIINAMRGMQPIKKRRPQRRSLF